MEGSSSGVGQQSRLEMMRRCREIFSNVRSFVRKPIETEMSKMMMMNIWKQLSEITCCIILL